MRLSSGLAAVPLLLAAFASQQEPPWCFRPHGAQTARSLAIIRAAVEALGGKMEHVIRTRMFVADVSQWEEVARVHGEVFKDIRPATTIVEVTKLIDAAALIEIEADAIVR